MTTNENEKRPAWTHKTPEDLARWLVSNAITKITHHWEMTGVDTSTEWIVLHAVKDQRRVNTNFLKAGEFEFAPDHRGLVREVPYRNIRESIDKIDAFENTNARERAEFERLKAKFG